MYFSGFSDYEFALNRKKRMIIAGFSDEAQRVHNVLIKTQIVPEIAGFVSPTDSNDGSYLGHTGQLSEIIKIHKVDEIVFCAKDIASREIIRIMTEVTGTPVDYKIAPPESMSIIGSNSIHTSGDLYMINFNSISMGHNRRRKRLFDLGVSFMFLLTWPFLSPFFKGIRKNIPNALKVMISSRTWVGYCAGTDLSGLPVLKKGVFTPSAGHQISDQETMEKLNIDYARDYKVSSDFSVFWKSFFWRS